MRYSVCKRGEPNLVHARDMSKCTALGISPFENENRRNLRTASTRTKTRLAARADEMHNWELRQTKDSMVGQSTNFADKQETLENGIVALRQRVSISNERARNRDSITRVQELNTTLEKTAIGVELKAQSYRRQLQLETSHTREL